MTTIAPDRPDVAELSRWATAQGLLPHDIDGLVLDVFLAYARQGHEPSHVPIPGMRDRVCEAREELVYEPALAVNRPGFASQFTYLLEHLDRVRGDAPSGPVPGFASPGAARVAGWIRHLCLA